MSEGRIVKIQKRKTAIVKEAFRGSGGTDPKSIENLKIMFGADDAELEDVHGGEMAERSKASLE
ncbi:hypothetical protein B0H13DRAFT_2656782 [Mycena leptocephala]|nr:hypothetical protein B0H13DRAFT_2656782 [Mycena leptocephala]